ncbi:hypothetical protein ACIO3O_05370 [Streptomyces sp. NPDC087440]|uniref:hypothetical protein n=1 Tax=Streptomyces sp. NPDC087440 TaxID=3365790 RepID=UPI0037F787B4
MTSGSLFVLILGLAALACGVWIALTAPARERQAIASLELRAAARCEMASPGPLQTVTAFRVLGTIAAVAGTLLALLSLI